MKRKENEAAQLSPGRRACPIWRYQIQVQGALDDSWSEWFGGVSIENQQTEDGPTIAWLTGTLVDQVALRGVLNKLWDLNLTLLSIECVRFGSTDEPAANLVEREQ